MKETKKAIINNLLEFKYVDNKYLIKMSPHSLLIKEFNELWKRDKSRNKIDTAKVMTYVYYMEYFMSPYLSYDEELREKIIIEDIFGKGSKFKPDDYVKAAMNKFRILQITPTMKHMLSVRRVLDQLTEYYNSISFDKENAGTFDPQKISKAIEKTADVISNIDRLEERVFKEVDDKENGIRGGGNIGMFELPDEIIK